MSKPSIACRAERAEPTLLDRYRPEHYRLTRVWASDDVADYQALMRDAYEPLGFMQDSVLPTACSDCYRLQFAGRTIAVFRLTPVEENGSAFFPLIPDAIGADGRRAKLLEVNNVVVAADFRATIVLGLILTHCATIAARQRYDFVVGITRYQTLRYFVDFGVVPVDHEPLHLLGRPDLLDFVIYYDVSTPASRLYFRQRSRRYFHQQYVMRCIQAKYGARPAGNPLPVRAKPDAMSLTA